MISDKELKVGRLALEDALSLGADACRVVINKSTSDLLDTLNSELEKITHCLDRSLSLSLFIDGKFATFSTNRLEESEIHDFVNTCIGITQMIEPDCCRALPDVKRCTHEALNGDELGLYDDAYNSLDAEKRKKLALSHCLQKSDIPQGFRLITEEGQYSDSEFDSITLDSNGLFCRHRETSFEYASEVTIENECGEKASAYWWTSSPMLKDFNNETIGQEALKRALSQIGAKSVKSGDKIMVVSSDVASKLVTPLQNALGGYAIQQNNSFLMDSLGKKVFSDRLTLIDEPHIKGESGSRLFDSEGIATKNMDIIRNGVVCTYFINTYISHKTGIEATIEDATRPHLLPFPKEGMDKDAILKACGEGIFVTGFNGGNCNSATGDFSYGVEGFEFKNGVLGNPVSEMVITGNFIELWNNLLYAGNDTRRCMSKLTPTLAFKDVSFSGE